MANFTRIRNFRLYCKAGLRPTVSLLVGNEWIDYPVSSEIEFNSAAAALNGRGIPFYDPASGFIMSELDPPHNLIEVPQTFAQQ